MIVAVTGSGVILRCPWFSLSQGQPARMATFGNIVQTVSHEQMLLIEGESNPRPGRSGMYVRMKRSGGLVRCSRLLGLMLGLSKGR